MWCCNKCIGRSLYANKNVEECKMKEAVKVLPSFEDVKGGLTPIPGFSPERYKAHCPSGHV